VDTVRLDLDVRRTIAPSGVTVLTERVAGVRSVAVGVWVRTASAHEARAQMGISHLLEHMVFKGTERRSAREIALALESRGGALDAYTSRDTTAFQARVLDRDLPRAVDVLTDVVRRPVLRESDLELERNVILEEINTVLDTPDDLVFDLSAEALWPAHPYGYTILGTRQSVVAMSAADLRERHYGAFQGLTYAQAKERLPAEYARFKAKDPQFAFGSGESLGDFFARATQCIQAIARRHDAREVLVFTHGGVLEMAYRHATGCGLSSPRGFELPNAALNWIEVGEREWRVLGWADCSHLAAALDDLAG